MPAPASLAALIFDSPSDIMVVVLIAVVLFGAKKIPEVMRGLGSGIREFKEGMREGPNQTAQTAPPTMQAPAASAPVEHVAAAPTEKK